MNCPICGVSDYMLGIFGHNCVNKKCVHFKGGSVNSVTYSATSVSAKNLFDFKTDLRPERILYAAPIIVEPTTKQSLWWFMWSARHNNHEPEEFKFPAEIEIRESTVFDERWVKDPVIGGKIVPKNVYANSPGAEYVNITVGNCLGKSQGDRNIWSDVVPYCRKDFSPNCTCLPCKQDKMDLLQKAYNTLCCNFQF